MSDWTGFDDLDLSDVEDRAVRLAPGEYHVVSRDAGMETIDAARKRLNVVFREVGGGGEIRQSFMLMHPNETSVRIARERLKSFLTHAKHPNPNKPGDISTLNGLQCGIVVGMGKPYVDKNGQEKQYAEIKMWRPVDEKAEVLDDEIPF